MVGDQECESPQFSKQRKNYDYSPTAQMNHQIAFEVDNIPNQTQFSHFTIKEFSLNGSPDNRGQITQSFGNNFLDKKIGNTQMSVIIEEQQRSCALSQVMRSKQNIDDSYSSQKQFVSRSNSQIGQNFREGVPSKPKILYQSQDDVFLDNIMDQRGDKKIAAKSIILGQNSSSSSHIDNNSKISRSNDQKRQHQLQALLKSNQDSQSKLSDPFFIESPSKQRLIDQRDNENRKLLSNISFYEEQGEYHIIWVTSVYNFFCQNKKQKGGSDQNVYQIYDNQHNSQGIQKQLNFTSKVEEVSIFTTPPGALSASYHYQKNRNDTFAGVTSISASFNKGFNQAKNNERQSQILEKNASHNGIIQDDMNGFQIKQESQDELNQDSTYLNETGGRQLEKQQIQDFLNSKTLKSLKKSQGVNPKNKRLKRSLGGGQQEKSQNGIQQYINPQNTKETITDYFKQTNTQIDASLPSFDQYLSNFKTQYDKNIKRRLKTSIQRKSYDIVQQNSKGFSQFNSKEDSSLILKEASTFNSNYITNPLSTTNRYNKMARGYGYIQTEPQTEESFRAQNFQLLQQQLSPVTQQQQFPPFSQQQQSGRYPQLIEILPKYETEYQRDASAIIKSVQNKLPPNSISTTQNETTSSNIIKDINDQLSSIKSVRQTKSLNRPTKFLTEQTDSEIYYSTNNPSTTKNQSYNYRIQENIKELEKLSTIHQEDTKHDLNSPSYEEGNEFTFAQKEKKMKGRLYEVELNNIKINLDFNLSNSLSNYVNQKIPMASSKIKNIPNKLTNNSFLGISIGSFYQTDRQPQSAVKDFQSSYASGFQNQNMIDRLVSKNSSNVTTMQFTNGTSTNATNTTKQTFQSPMKPQTTQQSDKSHLIYNLQDNLFIENIHPAGQVSKERNKYSAQLNFNKTQTPKQLDLTNIVSNFTSKTPSAKANNKMQDATNIYANKQQDPIEYFEKNKQLIQKRNAKTPIKQKQQLKNDNFIKIYKNQNSPENLLANFNDKSNKLIDQFKNITSNTPINSNNVIEVAQSFKQQRNLEKQYLNQNFQLRPFLYKVRTQSEGRKRQQNIRIKTQQ